MRDVPTAAGHDADDEHRHANRGEQMNDSIRVEHRSLRAALVRHRRLAIAGIVTATAIAVPTAALASGSDSPSGKPTAPPACAPGANKSAAAASKSAAAASKSAAVPPPAARASKSAAARSAEAVPAPVRAFATRLGVDSIAAGRALKEIAALSGPHGVDASSAAFTAIARDLGVSPAQLAGAWDAVRHSLTGR
jgi:hypothetical protein